MNANQQMENNNQHVETHVFRALVSTIVDIFTLGFIHISAYLKVLSLICILINRKNREKKNERKGLEMKRRCLIFVSK